MVDVARREVIVPTATTVMATYHDTDAALDALAHLRDLDGERFELVDGAVVHRDEDGEVALRSDRNRVVDAVDRAVSSPLKKVELEDFGQFIDDGVDLLVAVAKGPGAPTMPDEVRGADDVVVRSLGETEANLIEVFLEPSTSNVGFFD